ncbi:RNA-binding protein [Candidatus Woesearchaeota archaeon]|nr:RNA-binding protein [Candidatus Woesearchaeota archaeon]
MEKGNICNSCKKQILEGAALFKCPECGKSVIVRCKHCREIAARYTCEKCGFSGPN